MDLLASILQNVHLCTMILLMVAYSYEIVYALVALFFKKKKYASDGPENKFAFVITAKDEALVISELVQSIRAQDYPKELIEVFVLADNCTDNTAELARKAGAVVWERFDSERMRKGYGLDFLLKKIFQNYARDEFAGFFVFDADNLITRSYVKEMNKAFNRNPDHKAIVSFRNSKNYSDNWLSATHSLWFLRETQCNNYARMRLGTGCIAGGTGFLVSAETFLSMGGWDCHTLAEDFEFTARRAIAGDRIGYCETAMFYDEQPVALAQSWDQRLRWVKGHMQLFAKYGTKLFKAMVLKRSFSCFDMLMKILPAPSIVSISFVLHLAFFAVGAAVGYDILPALRYMSQAIMQGFVVFYLFGAITTFLTWKDIKSTPARKLYYTLFYPLFMYAYFPIGFVALFKRVHWKPIIRTGVSAIDLLEESD